MSIPFEYAQGAQLCFGGALPHARRFEDARAVVLPVPFERTTSYVGGTRNGPREILTASSHMELWDEELGLDVHPVGIVTLPEMELPIGELAGVMEEIRRVAAEILARDKFLVALGGEHSITPPLVAAAAGRFPGLGVLQIDAHADLRESFMGTPHNHACAMRRVLDHAPVTQVGIRSLSPEEAAAIPALRTTVFYDHAMRQDAGWIERVIDTLPEQVYVTVDVDGLDPGIMPATGTPEPGGLSWYEALALLRATIERRTVVACDVVELCPLPGILAPNFLCARLVYKILTYRFAAHARASIRDERLGTGMRDRDYG